MRFSRGVDRWLSDGVLCDLGCALMGVTVTEPFCPSLIACAMASCMPANGEAVGRVGISFGSAVRADHGLIARADGGAAASVRRAECRGAVVAVDWAYASYHSSERMIEGAVSRGDGRTVSRADARVEAR